MQVSAVDFVKSPDFYLDKVNTESVSITKGGKTVAVLTKPNDTPVTDSLLGLLKGCGIKSAEDIKAMRTRL
jgi:hypothetical protein